MELKNLKMDRVAEVEGVWMDVVVLGEVARMKIARAGNQAYERMRDRLLRPLLSQVRSGRLPSEKLQEIEIECVAHTILKDWEGLTNHGQPYPYSPENAAVLLREYPDILDAVRLASLEAERFRLELIEEAEGN